MILSKQARPVETEGFYHGTQGISPDSAQAELQAQFVQRQVKLRLDATQFIRMQEAKLETLTRRLADDDKHWRKLESHTNGMPPQLALPLLAFVSATLVVIGEALFLAPVMDGFGITDPLQQSILAMVLVLTSSGLLKLAIHNFHRTSTSKIFSPAAEEPEGAASRQRWSGSNVLITAALSVFALSLVFVLGWWRAEEMIFAASLQAGEAASFLNHNQTQTTVCVILLTVGLPVFAAVAFEYAFNHLYLAWEWRKARYTFVNSSSQLDQTRKRIEATNERVSHQISGLDEQRKEWTNAYLQSYELGRKVGAQKEPLWPVVIKIVPVTLCALLFCLLFNQVLANYVTSVLIRSLIYTCATLGLAALYACRMLKIWRRPTPLQLYKQRATIWRNESIASAYAQLPANGAIKPRQQPVNPLAMIPQGEVTTCSYSAEGTER
jgi:hypothetical protein